MGRSGLLNSALLFVFPPVEIRYLRQRFLFNRRNTCWRLDDMSRAFGVYSGRRDKIVRFRVFVAVGLNVTSKIVEDELASKKSIFLLTTNFFQLNIGGFDSFRCQLVSK